MFLCGPAAWTKRGRGGPDGLIMLLGVRKGEQGAPQDDAAASVFGSRKAGFHSAMRSPGERLETGVSLNGITRWTCNMHRIDIVHMMKSAKLASQQRADQSTLRTDAEIQNPSSVRSPGNVVITWKKLPRAQKGNGQDEAVPCKTQGNLLMRRLEPTKSACTETRRSRAKDDVSR